MIDQISHEAEKRKGFAVEARKGSSFHLQTGCNGVQQEQDPKSWYNDDDPCKEQGLTLPRHGPRRREMSDLKCSTNAFQGLQKVFNLS